MKAGAALPGRGGSARLVSAGPGRRGLVLAGLRELETETETAETEAETGGETERQSLGAGGPLFTVRGSSQTETGWQASL